MTLSLALTDAHLPAFRSFAVPSKRALAGAAMRAFDIAAAAAILLLASPVLLAIALMVWMTDGGPAFFSQARIGRDGRRFQCLKFRSMCVDADVRLARLLASDENARREWQADHKLRVDPRITPLGQFLRKTSLDETPQLINVLRGEMSLVGPRPIVDAEIPRYGRRFNAYCAQRPGIRPVAGQRPQRRLLSPPRRPRHRLFGQEVTGPRHAHPLRHRPRRHPSPRLLLGAIST